MSMNPPAPRTPTREAVQRTVTTTVRSYGRDIAILVAFTAGFIVGRI